jgi:RHH-type proline utilization regulon transcriptional repressor/proline dehydrogenase/delta 1-pyrroline-5-carboxylate dehydrogenase
VLGVMRAADLDEAIRFQNDTPYGLTGGIHSLDPDEIDHWVDAVQVGNAYVNRPITGAIVRRQPFGGWKQSSVGLGGKTGGPEDILRFVRVTGRVDPDPERWWRDHFGVAHDPSGLQAEANVSRYRLLPRGVLVRGDDEASVLHAARVTGTPVAVSGPTESEDRLIERLRAAPPDRLRVLIPISDDVRRVCHELDVTVDDTPATGHGRIELRCWLREQAVSRTRHRHGRVPCN